IASACRDHERLRFAYRARDGSATRRLVEPHSLANLGRRWYLVAWDCDRDGWRSFRVDRLASPAPAGGLFDARELPGGADPAAYVAANLSGGAETYEARITVHCAAEQLRERPWMQEEIRHLEGDICEYRPSDVDLDWLALRIAMIPFDYEVDGPAELIERLRAMQQRVAAGIA
ncbi:MAG TPA: WYL domain-containing protein, partial [Solirubrobacterales bacterium]|nr:WYL domain-containing protein [Solirubrobacterales bacterium]